MSQWRVLGLHGEAPDKLHILFAAQWADAPGPVSVTALDAHWGAVPWTSGTSTAAQAETYTYAYYLELNIANPSVPIVSRTHVFHNSGIGGRGLTGDENYLWTLHYDQTLKAFDKDTFARVSTRDINLHQDATDNIKYFGSAKVQGDFIWGLITQAERSGLNVPTKIQK